MCVCVCVSNFLNKKNIQNYFAVIDTLEDLMLLGKEAEFSDVMVLGSSRTWSLFTCDLHHPKPLSGTTKDLYIHLLMSCCCCLFCFLLLLFFNGGGHGIVNSASEPSTKFCFGSGRPVS